MGCRYESSLDILFAMYDKLSVGGMVIVDDSPYIGPSDRAIKDFRECVSFVWGRITCCLFFGRWHGITAPYHVVEGMGLHWVKEHEVKIRRDKYIAILTGYSLLLSLVS